MRAWLAALILLVAPPAAAREAKLLFFDPDANQERLLSITELFNRELRAKQSGVVFEPVQTAKDFAQRLASGDALFAIVGSSFLSDYGSKLTPLLVQQLEGQVYYHKLLVDMGAGPAGKLDRKAIAAAVTDKQANATLQFLKSNGVSANGALIISVSKDVDALLAMAFGQAQAALVTEGSIRLLQQLNPTAASKVRVLLKTPNILRAPLCEVAGRPNARERSDILQFFGTLSAGATGQQLLQVLGTDTWVPYAQGML